MTHKNSENSRLQKYFFEPNFQLSHADVTCNRIIILQVAFLFSDRGVPDGYRHMNGYGSNTFKLVNEDDEAVYCKFHYKVNTVQ